MADLVKSISEIFSNRSFRIPDYQRGYARRKEKQPNDIWQDLELLPNNRDHFTGTLLLKPTPYPNNEGIDRRGEDHHLYDEFVLISGMRWSIETIFEKAKGEVGFDHYEIRSWIGWHHPMLLVALAHHFLVRLRVRFQHQAPASG